MKEALVFGGAGSIGVNTSLWLCAHGWTVTSASRHPHDLRHSNGRHVANVDVTRSDCIKKFMDDYLASRTPEVAIYFPAGRGYSFRLEDDIARITVEGLGNVISNLPERIALVFISSASMSLPAYENSNPYTLAKGKAEKLLANRRDAFVIIRPVEAWGACLSGTKRWLLKSMSVGVLSRVMVPGTTNIISIEECGHMIGRIAVDWKSYRNQTLSVVGGPVSYGELAEYVDEVTRVKRRRIWVPEHLLRGLHFALLPFERHGLMPSRFPLHGLKAAYVRKSYGGSTGDLAAERPWKECVREAIRATFRADGTKGSVCRG